MLAAPPTWTRISLPFPVVDPGTVGKWLYPDGNPMWSDSVDTNEGGNDVLGWLKYGKLLLL